MTAIYDIVGVAGLWFGLLNVAENNLDMGKTYTPEDRIDESCDSEQRSRLPMP